MPSPEATPRFGLVEADPTMGSYIDVPGFNARLAGPDGFVKAPLPVLSDGETQIERFAGTFKAVALMADGVPASAKGELQGLFNGSGEIVLGRDRAVLLCLLKDPSHGVRIGLGPRLELARIGFEPKRHDH